MLFCQSEEKNDESALVYFFGLFKMLTIKGRSETGFFTHLTNPIFCHL